MNITEPFMEDDDIFKVLHKPAEDEYFDIVNQPLTNLRISETKSKDNCYISELGSSSFYKGFILSNTKLVQTICSVDFHPSSVSNLYVPRLVFKKVLKSTGAQRKTTKEFVRISFQKNQDGYEEFWKMIGFLAQFKDLVDIGDFEGSLRLVSNKEFAEYINLKESNAKIVELNSLMNSLDLSSTEVVQSLSIIKLLEEYREKVEQFINEQVNEMVVQDWLDEDGYKQRSKRCLIFGLEFINHTREGGVSGNRYDLLTRIGLENKERVLIELKSPNDDIFEERSRNTRNSDKIEYSLSKSLSRAIPQILEYVRNLQNKESDDPELQKIGEKEKVKISKSIIIIGAESGDPRKIECLRDLRKSLSSNLEIWTYTDLLHKINSTIINLKQG